MSVLIIKESGYKISTNVDDLTTAILAYGYIGVTNIHEKYNKYRLLSNDVDFFWGFTTPPAAMLIISYKGNELLKYDNPNNQLVIDYLNKFDGLTKKEVEELVKEAQENEKTALEISIEELKAEKASLEEQIKIYKAIQTKKEEIKALLEKLDE